MQAGGNAYALERLVLDEFLTDDLQHLHRLVRPFDAFLAQIGQFKSLNVAADRRSSHFSPYPRMMTRNEYLCGFCAAEGQLTTESQRKPKTGKPKIAFLSVSVSLW